MITEKEAKKERNCGIGFGIIMASIIIFSALYGYIYTNMPFITMFLMLLCALGFLKIAYDAYTMPLLYIRQRISLWDTYKEQDAVLKRTHKISKYNVWR